MIHFVQAANSAYGPAGWALFRSLLARVPGNWRMTWVALDADLAKAARLASMRAGVADRLRVVEPAEVYAVLLGLEATLAQRTGGPWFWTWASQAVAFVLRARARDGDLAVYLDTDIWFFGDPTVCLTAAVQGGASAVIHTHRFPVRYADRARRGVYNVGIVGLVADADGRAAAAWWAERVRAGCEGEMPELTERLPNGEGWWRAAGAAGDQPWLEAFPLFCPTAVIHQPGFALAPYSIVDGGAALAPTGVRITRDACGPHDFPLISFHYHESRFDARTGALVKDTGYPIPDSVRRHVYEPYYGAVREAAAELWAT